MAELEEELIGSEDLDYEYDLDEEQEEALLAETGPGDHVDEVEEELEDILDLGVDEDLEDLEDGTHAHLSGKPSSLSARLAPPTAPQYQDEEHYGEEHQDQVLEHDNNVDLSSSQQGHEEEEEEEEEEEVRSRDRFKNERNQTSLPKAAGKRNIPDSLDEIDVSQNSMGPQRRDLDRGRGRGRRGRYDRGRGGRGGMNMRGQPFMQPYPFSRGGRHQGIPSLLAPGQAGIMRINPWEGNTGPLMRGVGPQSGQSNASRFHGQGPLPLLGNTPRPLLNLRGPINSPRGPGGQLLPNPNVPVGGGMPGPFNWSQGLMPQPVQAALLNHIMSQSQPMMAQNPQNEQKLKRPHPHAGGDFTSPPKQIKMQQGPQNQQNMAQSAKRRGPNAGNRPFMGQNKPSVLSRLSGAPTALANSNLTTIKTVDLKAKPKQGATGANAPAASTANAPVAVANASAASASTAKHEKKVKQEKVEDDDPETREYRRKVEEQKRLRQQMLEKKEARRKAAAAKKASELAVKKEQKEKEEAKKAPVAEQQRQPTATTTTITTTTTTAVTTLPKSSTQHQQHKVPGHSSVPNPSHGQASQGPGTFRQRQGPGQHLHDRGQQNQFKGPHSVSRGPPGQPNAPHSQQQGPHNQHRMPHTQHQGPGHRHGQQKTFGDNPGGNMQQAGRGPHPEGGGHPPFPQRPPAHRPSNRPPQPHPGPSHDHHLRPRTPPHFRGSSSAAHRLPRPSQPPPGALRPPAPNFSEPPPHHPPPRFGSQPAPHFNPQPPQHHAQLPPIHNQPPPHHSHPPPEPPRPHHSQHPPPPHPPHPPPPPHHTSVGVRASPHDVHGPPPPLSPSIHLQAPPPPVMNRPPPPGFVEPRPQNTGFQESYTGQHQFTQPPPDLPPHHRQQDPYDNPDRFRRPPPTHSNYEHPPQPQTPLHTPPAVGHQAIYQHPDQGHLPSYQGSSWSPTEKPPYSESYSENERYHYEPEDYRDSHYQENPYLEDQYREQYYREDQYEHDQYMDKAKHDDQYEEPQYEDPHYQESYKTSYGGEEYERDYDHEYGNEYGGEYQQQPFRRRGRGRGRDIRSRLGTRVTVGPQHNLQVKIVQTTPEGDQDTSGVETRTEGVRRLQSKPQPVPAQVEVKSRRYRRITRKNKNGEVISIQKIPVDENGTQIGKAIMEFVNKELLEAAKKQDLSSHSRSSEPQEEQKIPVVKSFRHIAQPVRNLSLSQSQEHHGKVSQDMQDVKLVEKRKEQSSGKSNLKRTIITAPTQSPQDSSTSTQGSNARRVVTTSGPQSASVSGGSGRGRGKIVRRVVTASGGYVPSITPTTAAVKLTGLPTNLTATEVRRMAQSKGFRIQQMDYTQGSQECAFRFHDAEDAAKFYQLMNRKMISMSVIKATMME